MSASISTGRDKIVFAVESVTHRRRSRFSLYWALRLDTGTLGFVLWCCYLFISLHCLCLLYPRGQDVLSVSLTLGRDQ